MIMYTSYRTYIFHVFHFNLVSLLPCTCPRYPLVGTESDPSRLFLHTPVYVKSYIYFRFRRLSLDLYCACCSALSNQTNAYICDATSPYIQHFESGVLLETLYDK